MARQMVFALAGMDLWGFSADKRFLKDIALSFDLVALGERLATEFGPRDGDAAAALFGRSHLDPGHAALRRRQTHRAIDAALRRRADGRAQRAALRESGGGGSGPMEGHGTTPVAAGRSIPRRLPPEAP